MKTIMNYKKEKLYLPLLSIAFTLLLTCCTPNNPTPTPLPPPVCNTSNTDFQQIYSNLLATANHVNINSFDTEIHEYTFTLSANKALCSVGYQSQAAISSVPYKIELLDASNNILYSGNHTFSPTMTSYVSIAPINLTAGQSYTIRRTMLLSNAGGLFSNIIGRLVRNTSGTISFPTTSGIMTITGSKFYQNGGPLINAGVPYIDLAFQ